MHLYFSPMACSLASRIAVYEGALEAETVFHNVTLSTKRFDDDRDYCPITAKGQVPALVTRDGSLLTENAAVLQYLADLAPDAGLAPPPAEPARYQLQQWLSFIATELHKQVFAVVFDPAPPPEAKAFALEQSLPKWLGFVEHSLAQRQYLVGDRFTVADAYLLTVLNWCLAVGIDLKARPAIAAYHRHTTARPHVRRAIAEERALYEGRP